MKNVFRTVLFHIMCIIIFASIYMFLADQFLPINNDINNQNSNNFYKQFFDFLLISTSIQSGTGLTNLYPTTIITKSLWILQQLIMISTHLFTLYIFTI